MPCCDDLTQVNLTAKSLRASFFPHALPTACCDYSRVIEWIIRTHPPVAKLNLTVSKTTHFSLLSRPQRWMTNHIQTSSAPPQLRVGRLASAERPFRGKTFGVYCSMKTKSPRFLRPDVWTSSHGAWRFLDLPNVI